ncbi:hypothetical protein NKT34_13595 [Paenibacillus polysaccharolyticus]|uniref:hypothetical protein n=1 Tax=Paenibacillus polysaccharolyticus TaxID=582692 RepID=UPI00209F58E7|nr:hypothetical protein [Paenibacillus polysaccharolyticus]MCP1134333.1 hypothetical protein [Paenibacillus polysaccharolyticus]
MDHFEGVTPEQRWKNDMLREVRRINANMEQLLKQDHPQDEVETVDQPEQMELIPEPKQERKVKPSGTKSG